MASETRLIGAVGIKVRPVTKGFRDEIQDELRKLPDGEVKVTAKADTTKAQKEIDKLSEDRVVKLRIGPTYDDLKKARQQLENELKKLSDVTIPVKLDRKGIEEALGKLDDLDKKSKIVMKMVEDKEGYQAVLAKIRAVQREMKERLNDPIKIKVDEKSLAEAEAKYQKLIDQEPIKLRTTGDPDSLNRALAQIEGELDKLKSVELSVHTDKKSLETARRDLEIAIAKAKVSVKYTQDETGYKAVIARIKSIRSEKMALKVELATDEASLAKVEREMEEELDRLKQNATIKIQISDNTESVRKGIAEVDKALKELDDVTQLEIDVKQMDRSALLSAKEDLKALVPLTKLELTYGTDLESLRAAKAKLDSAINFDTHKTIKVDADEESLKETSKKIDELIRKAEKDKIKLEVEPSGLKVAAAELAWVSRARTVPFYIRINQKSLAVAQGILNSLSGYNTIRGLGRSLENLVTNFDTIMLKTATVGTALGGIVNTLTYAGTAALAIGDGISRAVGLLATAPAAVTALAAGVIVNIAAWKNFKGAIDGNEKALAALPETARNAAVALQGTWEKIQKPVQKNYWDAMGTTLQDLVNDTLPQVRDGLAETATHVGRFGAMVAFTIRDLALTTGMQDTFKNLAGFFDNSVTAARPLVTAIATLGQRGAEYLPQFGTWLGNMANRFNDFIQEADGLGRINQWIEEGVQSLKDMWRAGDGVIDILRGITGAAMDAGTNTLSEFADNLQDIGAMVQAEPFRSRLATIFEGARAGASALNAGVKNLGRAFGEQAPFIADVLELLGQFGGTLLTNISNMFSGKMFKSGLMDALKGLQAMVAGLSPSFSNMGNVIGTLGKTAGATFRGLTPLLNTVTDGLSDVADALGDELPNAADVLLRYMTNTFASITSVVVPISQALGGVLGIFNDLPSGVQRALIAFGAFTIMRNQVSKLFSALGNTRAFSALESRWRTQQIAAGNALASTRRFNAGLAGLSVAGNGIKTVAGHFSGIVRNADSARGAIGGVSKAIGGGLVTAGKGLFSLMGGFWGVALAAAAIGLSLYGQKQQEAKSKVQEHTAALEAQNGILGESNEQIIASNLVNDKSRAGTKSSAETIKALGRSVQDTAKTINEGGTAYDDMVAQLDEGISAHDRMTAKVTYGGTMIAGNSDKWNAWTGQMGIATDAVNGLDLIGLRDQVVAEHAAVSRSVQSWADRNDTLASSIGISEGMAASIKILGDAAGDAERRLSAYRDILDELNGVSKSAWERQRDLSASSRDLAGFLGEVDDQGNKLNTGLIDLTTGFTIHTEAGDKLGAMLDNLQSNQFAAAQQAYDLAGGQKNAAEAAAAAEAATAPYREELNKLHAQGLITDDELQALQRSLFGIPKSTPFELTDQNSAAFVQKKVEGLTETIKNTPNKQIEITEPLSQGVIKKLNDLGYVVRHLPNGNIQVTETGADATGNKINGVAVTPRFSVITAQANTAQAKADLDAEANNPRTVSFFAKAMGMIGPQANGGILNGNLTATFANGGITKMLTAMNNVKAFAGGGIENHVAQIARPSASTPIRVWAEEETHGEAYIPLAASKRPRSVSILNEVAKQFGYNLVPQHEVYADGGITGGGGSTGGSVAVNIGSYITQKSDTPDDVARALMRRVKAQGAYSPLEAF